MASPSLQSQLVRPVLVLARERGLEVECWIERYRLPADAEQAREITLPLTTLRALLDDAAIALAEPHLGLLLAQRIERGTYGVVEYSCRSAPDMREALRRMARYGKLVNELVQFRFVEEPAGARIEQSLPGSPGAVSPHANEFFAANVLGKCRELSGKMLNPRAVLFAHAAPSSTATLVSALGTERLSFGQGLNALCMDGDFLDAPITTFDPSLLALLDGFAARELEGAPQRSEIVTSVRESIRRELREGGASIERAAREIGTTKRTLQRRLESEGTSCGAEVESVREELARVHVADRSCSLAEVAYLLGYSDLSTFVRAFRRWTGMTPARFRSAATASGTRT